MKDRAIYNSKTGKGTYSRPARNIDVRPDMIIEDNALDTKQNLASKKGINGAAKLLFNKL